MSSKLKASIYLLVASAIWGFGYVVNRQAVGVLSPWSYSTLKFLVGGLSVLPLAWALRRTSGRYLPRDPKPYLWLTGGIVGGVLLFIGSGFQMYGTTMTTAGKAGFITGLYLSMVPILGLFLGQIPKGRMWIGLLIGLAGLGVLSFQGGFSLGTGDRLLLIANVFWASHVLLLGYLCQRVANSWLLTGVQALVCAALSLVAAIVTNTMFTWAQLIQSALLVSWSVMSVGVAFYCQAKGQIKAPPASAALIMQSQAPIGALSGVIFLGEALTGKMIIGGLLMIAGALTAQTAKAPDKRPPIWQGWGLIKKRPSFLDFTSVKRVLFTASNR